MEDKGATHNATFRATLNMHHRAAENTPAAPQRKFGPFLQACNFSRWLLFVVFRKLKETASTVSVEAVQTAEPLYLLPQQTI